MVQLAPQKCAAQPEWSEHAYEPSILTAFSGMPLLEPIHRACDGIFHHWLQLSRCCFPTANQSALCIEQENTYDKNTHRSGAQEWVCVCVMDTPQGTETDVG